MEQVLFHVMDDDERVVVYSMDHDGGHRAYYPGRNDVNEMWPRYGRYKPYLDSWFEEKLGSVVSSPYAEYHPGTSDYPRGLAAALTHDPVLSVWAYVTDPDILVSVEQVKRALGACRKKTEEYLDRAGVSPKRDGGGYRTLAIGDLKRAFGQDTAGRIVLYSGQIASFLGVSRRRVPGIVDRLGIGIPDRPNVGVPWSTLRRVRRTGPRSYELRDA